MLLYNVLKKKPLAKVTTNILNRTLADMNNSNLTGVVLLRNSLFLLLVLLGNFFTADCQVRTRANLMLLHNNGSALMDGNMTNYAENYSNAVDGYDIWKMSNFGENFGILRGTSNLSIERRKTITSNDTTYFRIWNLQQRNYSLQVICQNLHLNNLSGFVHDNFTNQDVPVNLNDTSYINFTVTTQAGSFASNRFKLIFRVPPGASLPMTFTSMQAFRKSNDVMVNWEVENESLIDKYIVEVSSNDVDYQQVNQLNAWKATSKLMYGAQDLKVQPFDLFYRVKAVSNMGKVQYSPVVKVAALTPGIPVSVFPNPVVGKTLGLQLGLLPVGSYTLQLVNIFGRVVYTQLVSTQAQGKQTVQLPATTASGMYYLRLSNARETVASLPIMIR